MIRPRPTRGLHHVALQVRNLEACERFYVDLLGMQVEWRPDDNSVYLTSGNDNLALHRTSDAVAERQSLDHMGFIIEDLGQVDEWYDYLRAHDVPMKTAPRTHRDGARSFYCLDPEGITVQMIYHPPIADKI